MKIKYNSPIILTYAIIALGVLALSRNDILTKYFSSPAHLSFLNPYFYIRSIAYIAGQ